MTEEIKYPEPPKYFIAYDGDYENMAFGYCETSQTVTTGLENLDLYVEFKEFQAILLSNGVSQEEIDEVFGY